MFTGIEMTCVQVVTMVHELLLPSDLEGDRLSSASVNSKHRYKLGVSWSAPVLRIACEANDCKIH